MKRLQKTAMGFGVLLAAMVTACGNRIDMESEREALRKSSDEYMSAEAAKDAGRLVSFYAEDAIMYPHAEPTVTGKENIRKYAANVFATPDLNMHAKNLVAQVSSSGDMAYTVNMLGVTMKDPQGNPVGEQFRNILIWKKSADGQWQIVIDLWNSEPPGADTAATKLKH
jgi:uncharacterized protein (TIGR02246 family)